MAILGYLSTEGYSALIAGCDLEDDAGLIGVTYPVKKNICKAQLRAEAIAANVLDRRYSIEMQLYDRIWWFAWNDAPVRSLFRYSNSTSTIYINTILPDRVVDLHVHRALHGLDTNLFPRLSPHLRDLEVIIHPDAGDRHDETRNVDGREGVVEHDSGGGDGDDFLEDAADGEGDDGGAFEEGEFGGDEAEGETAGEEEEQDAWDGAFGLGKYVEAGDDGAGALDEEGEEEERDEHDGREEEDGGVGIGGGGVAEEEDLRQGPAEAGEEGACEDEDEADGAELRFTRDHHNDAGGHGGDDGAEFPRGLLEAEEEREEQDEGEGGGLAHCEEGQGDEAEGGITQADVEGGCGAAGEEARGVKEGCHERFGRCFDV